MANFDATHPLDVFFDGLDNNPSNPGVTVEVVNGLGMAQVFAAKGNTRATERALSIKQSPGSATFSTDMIAVPLSPGQWMAISAKPDNGKFSATIAGKLKKNGYVSEQGDARVVFRLSGPKVRELMAKGCRLDLHESKTGRGWCAQTQMAQAGVIILQRDTKPTYDILVYSGFANHFAEWLLHTGLQLGIAFKR